MADYPISNVPRRVQYVNSGVGPYAFTFEILVQTDIAVYRGNTLLTLTTDYSVVINANGTGSITLVTAGTGNITIVGARAIQRSSDYTTGGDLFASTLNTDLDSQTIYSQQLAENLDRTIKIPITDASTLNMQLPTASSRANKVFGFDSVGAPQVSTNTLAAIDAAVDTIESIASAPSGNSAGIAHIAAGTGAVATTVQTKLRETVSVKDFGGNLATAIAGIGATKTTLNINENITVSTNLTVPFNIAIEVTNESVITIGANTLLTINGPFNAAMCQAFTYTNSTSSVVFGQGTKQVIPQWWGATGNGSTVLADIQNETDAMIACFVSVRNAFTTSNWANNSTLGPSTVFVPRGVYAINKALPVFLNVHVTGEGGNNSPLSFIVQQDLTKSIFEMIPQSYNPDWTVDWETVSTGTIYSIGFGSYQTAPQSASNAPAIRFNSIRQATAYCNANFPASGGSTSAIGGYSDLHFKYVRFVNCAGYCLSVDDCFLATDIHDCLFDNSFGGIRATGSSTGGINMQHSIMYTMLGSAITLKPTSGNGFSLTTFDGTYFGIGFISNNLQAIDIVNPTFVAGNFLSIDSCRFVGYDYSGFKYSSGIQAANLEVVRIQNTILNNLDAPGSSKYISTTDCKVIKISGNIFQSDSLVSYTASNFINLDNSNITSWSIDLTTNQFYNYSASAFTNIVAAATDYANSNVTFSFNIINGPVTTPLNNNLNIINKFGNVGSIYPALLHLGGTPGYGTWKVGDIVYNTTPTSGGNIGWVCTTAGTPGTWKTFGAIA